MKVRYEWRVHEDLFDCEECGVHSSVVLEVYEDTIFFSLKHSNGESTETQDIKLALTTAVDFFATLTKRERDRFFPIIGALHDLLKKG